MKPKTQNKSKYNQLRIIIRNCMSETKQYTWSEDIDIQKCANWQWNELNKIFHKLGPFTND